VAKVKGDPDALRQKAELEAAVERARGQRQAVLRAIQEPAVAKILARYEAEVEVTKENLVDAKKAQDVYDLQAQIKARRALIANLKDAFKYDLEESEAALSEFCNVNALLIQGEQTKAESQAEPQAAAG